MESYFCFCFFVFLVSSFDNYFFMGFSFHSWFRTPHRKRMQWWCQATMAQEITYLELESSPGQMNCQYLVMTIRMNYSKLTLMREKLKTFAFGARNKRNKNITQFVNQMLQSFFNFNVGILLQRFLMVSFLWSGVNVLPGINLQFIIEEKLHEMISLRAMFIPASKSHINYNFSTLPILND